MLFDRYVADTAAGAGGLDQKSCTVRLQLEGPPGWEYSLFAIDYRGYADLQAGIAAQAGYGATDDWVLAALRYRPAPRRRWWQIFWR